MDKVFRALADPSRREILRMLRNRSLASGEIAQAFPSTWATISRHLAILREAGLVTAQREGQSIRYELNTSVFQDVLQHVADWAAPKPRERSRRVGPSPQRRVP